jgi:O-antigen ligase
MIELFKLLAPFFLPLTLLLASVLLYRACVARDRAALLLLILGVVIIVDTYMFQGFPIPGVKHGTLRYSELLVGLYLLLFYSQIRRQQNGAHPVPIKKIYWLWAAYLVLFIIAVLRSEDTFRHFTFSFRGLAVLPFVIFLLASWGLTSKAEYKRFSGYLLILGVLIAVGSYQMMFMDWIFIKSPAEDVFYHAVRNRRFGSFFGNPNRLGAFYVLTLPTFFVLLLYIKSRALKLLAFLAVAFILFAFLKTFSRGAYLGLTVGMSFFMFYSIPAFPLRKKLATVLAILIFIPIFAPNIYTGVFNRLSTIEKETRAVTGKPWELTELDDKALEASRSFLWSNAVAIIMENPLFGVGWGISNYGEAIKQLVISNKVPVEDAWALYYAEHPHNSYLFMSAFLGNVALLVFIFMLLYLYKANLSAFRIRGDDELHLINFGYVAGISGFLVAVFFDYQLFTKNTLVPFWMVIGLNLSLLTHVYQRDRHPAA